MLLSQPDLWNDQGRAQQLMKERTGLQADVDRVNALGKALEDAGVLIELGELEDDASVTDEVRESLSGVEATLDRAEFTRMLSGEQDHADAILTINAGAGGTDSQDWAEMLLRMYSRFCERQGWEVELVDRHDGEEAGIKSASLTIKGEYAYGMLKAEAGVHRLVRISPFDANARRQTAFAAAFVYPDIEDDIDVEVNDKDLRVDTYRASGAGGQHINKTSSAIRITHIPTGVVVTCQAERSQHKNRDTAMKMLRARLYDLEVQARNAEKDKIEANKADIEFGSQIRNYVMHPYRMVKDVRTAHETAQIDAVLDGDIEDFIKAYLIAQPGNEQAASA